VNVSAGTTCAGRLSYRPFQLRTALTSYGLLTRERRTLLDNTASQSSEPGRNHQGPPKRRGRPPGSVSLTDEIERMILSYVRAGAFLHVAAQAAGISPRTLFDWLNRAEGGPGARPSTPRLDSFAQKLRIAQAETRVGAEARVYRDNPALWLKNAARSKGELEGWSDPAKASSAPTNTLEAWIEELDESQWSEARRRVGASRGCGEKCSCEEHAMEVDREHRRISSESED
jgi:hypothetical protein